MSISYETGEGGMHFSWARVCAGPQTSTVPGFFWQERAAFDGLMFSYGGLRRVCLNVREWRAMPVENGRVWKRNVRDTPIDIPLISAPVTRRLSADEIQISCKAVR